MNDGRYTRQVKVISSIMCLQCMSLTLATLRYFLCNFYKSAYKFGCTSDKGEIFYTLVSHLFEAFCYKVNSYLSFLAGYLFGYLYPSNGINIISIDYISYIMSSYH